MKLKSVQIKDFKRFTDLTVQKIPQEAKLIILVGPNGCGKSSFFDALNVFYMKHRGGGYRGNEEYYRKTNTQPSMPDDGIKIQFYDHEAKVNKNPNSGIDPTTENDKKAFYIRTAYRNESEFQLQRLEPAPKKLDADSPRRMIDNNVFVSMNYQRLAMQFISDAVDSQDKKTPLYGSKEHPLEEIRALFSELFLDIELCNFSNPLIGETFRFSKGSIPNFAYMNLSGGEKAAFELILDLVVAKKEFDNTIFCIDEPEAHMHTRLQSKLLNVLLDLIPDNCQLMLATHAIGMMRAAYEIAQEKPNEVVFLDFEKDFDKPQIIKPIEPDRTFWKKTYEIALGDLAKLVAPDQVVVCEGQPKSDGANKNQNHDAYCYEKIFEKEFPLTKFISMGNKHEVSSDKVGLKEILPTLIQGLQIIHLIDRDDLTDEGIKEKNKQGIRVLHLRNLESYLFDDEVLGELAKKKGREEKIEQLLEEKQKIIKEKGCRDNLKLAKREFYIACIDILDLIQCGDTPEEFMRDTLAPLIKPNMEIYKILKNDIFGDDSTPQQTSNN